MDTYYKPLRERTLRLQLRPLRFKRRSRFRRVLFSIISSRFIALCFGLASSIAAPVDVGEREVDRMRPPA